jgi:predicted transcriptional regulator
MKINELKQRLRKDRAMTTVDLRLPADVVEDLKQMATRLGFSSHQALMRAYIGQGLRADLERLAANPEVSHLIESLRRRGVSDEVIASAVAEARERVEAA